MSFKVSELPPLGYGTPDAKISYKKKLENGEVYEPALKRAFEIIKSGECMVEITESDDGCIDGRPAVNLIMPSTGTLGNFEESTIENPYEHVRAKVAGGGYFTSLAMKLALDPHITHINEDLQGVAEHLTHLGIYCGLHTGAHSHEDGVDCGANDKFSPILHLMNEQNGEINGTVRSLWPYLQTGSPYSEDVEKITNEGVRRTLGHEGYFDNSSGKDRFKVIMNSIARAQEMVGGIKPVAVSKHLDGEHNEMAALIIFSRGKTFSQPLLRQRLIEEFPDIPEEKFPQVFVVDGFRVVDLAEAMTKGRPNEAEALPVALHAGFDYQLATEAALTDGTLPTILITEGERLAA